MLNLVFLVVYFLPAIIGYALDRRNKGTIFVVNFFLGWTFIGWVVPLMWALKHDKTEVTTGGGSFIEDDREALKIWEHTSVFQKRTYLFDTVSEFKLFKTLVELFEDKYYIFPQINLSHLIEPKDKNFYEHRKNRSRIEKKSVDFVLCDKDRVVPQLVIELDGYSHKWESRVTRDVFVNELMRDINMPILRLQAGNLDKEFIKGEIERALATK